MGAGFGIDSLEMGVRGAREAARKTRCARAQGDRGEAGQRGLVDLIRSRQGGGGSDTEEEPSARAQGDVLQCVCVCLYC